jgi:alkylation response protein AidB-like acyl-CoA dehydrogenase
MTDWRHEPDERFRAAWREWLEANYPREWRSPFKRIIGEDERRWLRTLHRAGWRAPGWPVEHGGMGLGLAKQLIYQDELDRVGASRNADLGAFLLAPIIMRYGTPEQKQRYLPAILCGEELWCQGYSEPGAGSDLASLRTSAVRDGDILVINGQKIWTSMAGVSDAIFMLVRTSRSARKQQGITFLVASLNTPGITVRPIENLAGDREFCEVFFDDARVPLTNVVGGIDEGWTVAKALLGVERIMTGSPYLANRAFAMLVRVAKGTGVLDDAHYADRLGRAAFDLHDVKALYASICQEAIEGRTDELRLSYLKIAASELFQRLSELAIEIAGDLGGTRGPLVPGTLEDDIFRAFMVSRPATIYGGTGEVQRNIAARILLGAEAKAAG